MIALFTLLTIVLMPIIVVRIGAIALELTGLSPEIASFQAQSAFSGAGFTDPGIRSYRDPSVAPQDHPHSDTFGKRRIYYIYCDVGTCVCGRERKKFSYPRRSLDHRASGDISLCPVKVHL